MNDLINKTKAHSNILFDIENVLKQAGLDDGPYSLIYKDNITRTNPSFNLPRMEGHLVNLIGGTGSELVDNKQLPVFQK